MRKDGGPAFPITPTDRGGQCAPTELGMSLRDYFAAAALKGILASYSNSEHINTAEESAKEAYTRADAMLAERDK